VVAGRKSKAVAPTEEGKKKAVKSMKKAKSLISMIVHSS
jgi:hypothetical protein